MYASDVRRTEPFLGLAVRGVGWAVAGLAGWLLFRACGGPAAPDRLQIVVWLLAAGLTLVLGLLAHRLAGDDADSAMLWSEFAAVGCGFAISAGWTIGVNLGGPLTGLAAATAVVAGGAGLAVRRVLPAAVLVAGAMVLGRFLHGEKLTVLGLAATLGLGLLCLGLVSFAANHRDWVRPTALLIAAWGAAWVGAWFVTTRVLDQYSVPLSLAGEIVGAMAVGGWATAVACRRTTGEMVWRVVARWTLGALLAYAAAWGIAVSVWTTGWLPGDALSHLDVGTVVALPFAVRFAVLPTLRRLTPAGAEEPKEVRTR